jgi:cob(I)alamin adenosyltransferase
MPMDLVLPGGNPVAAALDVARTVVRRAERGALVVASPESHVVPYINRMSD